MAEPDLTHQLQNAVSHHLAGQTGEAENLYRQILHDHPNNPNAMHLLGMLYSQLGRHELALTFIERAVSLDSTFPGGLGNLGLVLGKLGRFEQSLAAYNRALAAEPQSLDLLNMLGTSLGEMGRPDDAVAVFRRALGMRPNHPETLNRLGNALRSVGAYDEAVALLRRALEIDPDYAEAHLNLGTAFREQRRLDEAVECYRRVLTLAPDSVDALTHLGGACELRGDHEQALALYGRAIALNPSHADAHWNRALTLLILGRLAEGWREFEWRWRCMARPRAFSQPLWTGQQDLSGRTILLHAEQGFGDTIQFARYVPVVAARGAKVIFQGQARLRRLLRNLAGASEWRDEGEPLPPFDLHSPLMSLPLCFETTLETIPADVPYIRPDAQEVGRWHRRGRLAEPGVKVGLSWAGRSPLSYRSIALSQFAPLAGVAGVRFYNLQKGEAAQQVADSPLELIDLTADPHDFADTAALIANLDLIISVDTAVAHLAGAMGKPTWTLIPSPPDWRWLLRRTDSPWYPTMRLFRQPSPGDWQTPVEEVCRALRTFKFDK